MEQWRPRLLHVASLTTLMLALVACETGNQDSNDAAGVLFADEFAPGSTGDWLLEGDELGETAVVDERLIIEVNDVNTLQFATLAEPDFTDFALEVDARQEAGSPDSSTGVLVRMQDNRSFYRFAITGTGLFTVEKRAADGGWERLSEDWPDAAAVNQGLNVTNRLKVVARGQALSFSVNDILVLEIEDSTFARGTIALAAGSFSQPGVRVAFDNVVITEPEQ